MITPFRPTALFLLLAIAAGCAPTAHFLERGISIHGTIYRYRVWLPPHYTRLHRWPVILFLHGSDERGDDNQRQLLVGLGPALDEHGARYKAVIVFPQCSYGQEWYGDMETQALAALEKTIEEFRGDRRRIYVTGISMGGTGAWFLARHPQRFAAIIPVCGEIARRRDDPFPIELPPDLAQIVRARDPYLAMAEAIGKTPVWAFHGTDDDVIPVTESRNMADALRHTRGDVRYTEYPGVGHACWDLVYSDPKMIEWLLAQRLP